MTKTFKIGECCYGGIARVSTKPRGVFSVELLDWDSKEVIQWRFVYGLDELRDFMEESSTYYWADKIYNHFKK